MGAVREAVVAPTILAGVGGTCGGGGGGVGLLLATSGLCSRD